MIDAYGVQDFIDGLKEVLENFCLDRVKSLLLLHYGTALMTLLEVGYMD